MEHEAWNEDSGRLTLEVLEAHGGGNPARIITGGLPELAGDSVRAARESFMQDFDRVRTATVLEPRGGLQTSGVVLVPPRDPRADLGVFFMEPQGYPDVCGSDTIATAAALYEVGMLRSDAPEFDVTFETPAGLVAAHAIVEGGHVGSVTFTNVPAFACALDAVIEVPGHGAITADIGWGGSTFALVDAAPLGLALKGSVAPVRALGAAVLRAVQASGDPLLSKITHVLFHTASRVPREPDDVLIIIAPGTVDRSPCGAGTTTRAAVLAARGELSVGDSISHRGPAGSVFSGRVAAIEGAGEEQRTTVQITGAGALTGEGKMHIFPHDPLSEGFAIDD